MKERTKKKIPTPEIEPEIPDRLWETPPESFEEVFERLNLEWLLEDDPVPFKKVREKGANGRKGKTS